MSVLASDACKRPSAIEGRWTSAKGIETRTTSIYVIYLRPRELRDLDTRRFAIAFVERPRLPEPTDRPGYRTVILVYPLVILDDFVDESRLFSLLVFGQTLEITRIALQVRKRRFFDVVNRTA